MGDPLYERLGVAPDATDAEIRRAWLRLARIHHPDAQSDPQTRAAAEIEMRSINEAWAVLGDPARRAAHDQRRRLGSDGAVVPASSVRRTDDSFVFVPIDDAEDEVDPRLLDDTGVAGTEVDRSVQMLPVLLALGGVAGLVLGVLIALPFLVAVGAVGLALAVLSFVVAPLQAISRSITAERRDDDVRRGS